MKSLDNYFLLLILFVLSPLWTFAQENICEEISVPRAEFEYRTDFARVDVQWYQEWLDMNNGEQVYPPPLAPIEKWDHPFFASEYPSSMHEDSHSSDVSNYPGPIPDKAEVQYFHVLEKGGEFSGMAPAFNFIADDTVVTLSFGRANTHLMLVYVGDTI